MNRVTLIGHVGQDPEIRTFDNGDRIANFSLATNERWKDRETGEKKEHTDWHKIVVSGPLVAVVEGYVTKGQQIAIEGQSKTRKYEKDGEDRYITEVVLRGPRAGLELLGGRGQGGGDAKAQAQADAYREGPGYQGGDAPAGGGFDDEITF